jgi:hypothetical protein
MKTTVEWRNNNTNIFKDSSSSYVTDVTFLN